MIKTVVSAPDYMIKITFNETTRLFGYFLQVAEHKNFQVSSYSSGAHALEVACAEILSKLGE